MVWLFLVCQTGKATDATAQEVNANKLDTVAATEMTLPGWLWCLNFDGRCLGWQ